MGNGCSEIPCPICTGMTANAVHPPASECSKHSRELKHLNDVLHRKNIALDALNFVWCDGGCEGGTHRSTEGVITEEVVLAAEHHAKRLRTWWENYRWKIDAQS